MTDNLGTVPRETNETFPFEVLVDGTPHLTNVEWSLVHDSDRPVAWTPATVVGGSLRFAIADLTAGRWRLFARITEGGGDVPVIDVGVIVVT